MVTGALYGMPVTVGVQDFEFLGGSLGMAAGSAVVTGLETAMERRTPFILFVASGGARMQEGILSLMADAADHRRGAAPARGRTAVHRRTPPTPPPAASPPPTRCWETCTSPNPGR